MAGNRGTRGRLAIGLTLAATLTTGSLRADIAPDWPRVREPGAGEVQPGSESEESRESCVNAKSLPWLPVIELPHPDRPGQAALDWRPWWALRRQDDWLAACLAAAGLALSLALGLRRLVGWRRLAVLPAVAPALVGLAMARWRLEQAAEGLAVPWSCVPREGVFQRHAQLARDLLAATSLGSLGALVGLAGLTAFGWRPRPSGRALVPVVALLAGVGWFEWQWWPHGREGELARQVSGSLAAVAAQGIRLPTATDLPSVRLPDVPLVTVSADGTLRYDDRRGQRPPTDMPLLLPLETRLHSSRPGDDALDHPPFFLLAIDERTPWQALGRALQPLDDAGYAQRHWLLYSSSIQKEPGAPPRAPAVVFWAQPSSTRLRCGSLRGVAPVDPYCEVDNVLIGWLDERGLRLQAWWGELGEGCEQRGPGVAVPRERLDRDGLARCLAAFEGKDEPPMREPGQGESPLDLLKVMAQLERRPEFLLLLAPSPTTPWGELALLLEAFERPRPAGRVTLKVQVAQGTEQGQTALRRLQDAGERQRALRAPGAFPVDPRLRLRHENEPRP